MSGPYVRRKFYVCGGGRFPGGMYAAPTVVGDAYMRPAGVCGAMNVRGSSGTPTPTHDPGRALCRKQTRVVGDADPYGRGGFHIRPGRVRRRGVQGRDESLPYDTFIYCK